MSVVKWSKAILDCALTPAFKIHKLSCAYMTNRQYILSLRFTGLSKPKTLCPPVKAQRPERCDTLSPPTPTATLVPSVLPLGLLPFPSEPGLTHFLQSFTWVHDEGQSHASRAVTALPGEAQEGCPEEGAAAHEGRSHVQRHQDEVQEL